MVGSESTTPLGPGEDPRWRTERPDKVEVVLSHDIRNPLNIAIGRLELARAECDSEHLDAVADAHDRMEELVDDLLTLARDGGSVGELEPVDLGSVAERCWRTVATHESTLVVDVDRTVRADPSRLLQLFENLVRNAIEHGGDDVTITVGELDDGFSIADDGPGIPTRRRDRVFDVGYSAAAEGTGYGLAIVADVVDAHGWDISITDSDDDGTRFEITGVESTR